MKTTLQLTLLVVFFQLLTFSCIKLTSASSKHDRRSNLLSNVKNFFAESDGEKIGKSLDIEDLFGQRDQFTREETCVCGVLGPPSKVVGGVETKRNEYPWMAALFYNGHLRCGATLINDRFVVTAAHCVTKISPRFMSVYLASHNISAPFEAGRVRFNVAKVMIHPEYDVTSHQNDIAILELSRPVTFGASIIPACLPSSSNANFDGQKAIVTGWGRTLEGGFTSTVLRKATVPVVNHATCQENYENFDIDEQRMLCAGPKEGGKDACQGDSGGPLIVNINGHYTLIGVVSFGEGCARPEKPGVYARVSFYLEFIVKSSDDAMFCPAYKKPKPRV